MSSTVQSQSSFLPTDYLSGGLSISGLGNGTDFSEMIENLRKIELIPTQRMLRWKAEWRERQDAFKVVREQLVALRDVCSKMNTMDKFLVKTASSSRSDTATATAGSSAIENSYKLEVRQVATTSIWSLENSFYDNKSSVNTSSDTQVFSYEYKGMVRSINVPPNTTLESFKNMINNDSGNPGVRASLIKGSNGVTFQIKGMDQGEKNDLTIISANNLAGFPSGGYTPHSIAYTTQFDNATDVVNDTQSDKVFSFSYKGNKYSVDIPHNTDVAGMQTILQNFCNTNNLDISVDLSANSGGKQVMTFTSGTPGQAITIPSNNDWANLGKPATVSGGSWARNNTTYTALTDVVNNTGGDVTFTYSYNGVQQNVVVPDGTDLQGFLDLVNQNRPTGMKSVTASLQGGTYQLSFSGDVTIDAPLAGMGATTTGGGDPAGWHVQHSQNAMIKVDGWPSNGWLEVDSNSVSDAVEGVTFTLIGEGTAIISVNTDAEAIQENVMSFIEAVNMFRKTINDLTKYDTNKETFDLEYAESLFEMQKGSILTGNYGIQLLSSRLKQATAGMPKGFMPRFEVDGIFHGDLFTSLSQIGIKTNAEGSGGDQFGMLELNEDPKLPMLTDVLRDNPQAVAEFFAAVNQGVSDSSDFSYSDSLHNITRPGAYGVEYTVSTDPVTGKKTVTGTINGKPAKWYEDTGQLGILREGPKSDNSNAVSADFTESCDFDVQMECTNLAQKASYSMETDINWADRGAEFVSDGGGGEFKYTYNGQVYSVNVEEKDSLSMIAARINFSNENPGVTAKVVEDGGKCKFVIESNKEGNHDGNNGPMVTGIDMGGITPIGSVTGTSIVLGEDAAYRYSLDGGATWQTGTSKTNQVTDAVRGVTFNLKQENTGPVTLTGKQHNDADGMYIQVDNLADGTYTGQVRMKQGKIPELLEMLNGTAAKPEEGMLGSKGAIQVLLDNYDKIVEGIDNKIQKETDRISKWERTTKLRFSRLEATLKQYDSLNKMVESQVKQLGGGK